MLRFFIPGIGGVIGLVGVLYSGGTEITGFGICNCKLPLPSSFTLIGLPAESTPPKTTSLLRNGPGIVN